MGICKYFDFVSCDSLFLEYTVGICMSTIDFLKSTYFFHIITMHFCNITRYSPYIPEFSTIQWIFCKKRINAFMYDISIDTCIIMYYYEIVLANLCISICEQTRCVIFMEAIINGH